MRRSLPWLVALLVVCIPVVASAGNVNCEFAAYEAKGWVWMFLGAFGFGFLTSLTPCVYPMIPITLAIFGARGKDVSKKRAMLLATAYVNGMCLTYTILGVTFAMIGKAGDFGTQLASPYVVFPLVALFLALAASMFGAFDLNLPASWQAKLNQVGGKGFGGAFAMGLVGGLIAAPCTGPFLAGLLAYVATSANVVGGGALLYVYGLGMGILFFVLAAFAVALPKSGKWMEAVKSIGGIGLLLAALYYLLPFMPALRHIAKPDVTFLLISLGMAAAGFALGAVNLAFKDVSMAERARKGAGVALVVCGLFGAYMWKQTPKRDLPIMTDEAAAFAKARAEHKNVMVDFAAEWCQPCKRMEVVFGTDEVYDAITKDFIVLKFDVTKDNEENIAKKNQYDVPTLPGVVFVTPDGDVLGRIRKEIDDSDTMLEVINAAVSHTASNPCGR